MILAMILAMVLAMILAMILVKEERIMFNLEEGITKIIVEEKETTEAIEAI